MGIEPDIDAIRQFLRVLDQIHLALIPQNGGGVIAYDFGVDCDAAVGWIVKHNKNGFNAYWTVNRVRMGCNTKPAKADINAARFAFVDLDPPKGGGTFDKAAALARLLAYPNGAPSFVIDSGGGLQAFWAVTPNCLLETVERANIALRDLFEGDACQNIDRLGRLPGTINWPNKKKLSAGRVPILAKIIYRSDGNAL